MAGESIEKCGRRVRDTNLLPLLRRLNARLAIARRFDDACQEDVMQDVYKAILEKRPLDQVVHVNAYISTMLQHRYADEHDRRRRLAAAVAKGLVDGPAPPQEDEEEREREELSEAQLAQWRGRLRAEVEAAAQAAIARRSKEHQEEARLAWEQIRALSFEGATTAALIVRDEGVTPRSGPAQVKKAKERLYQNHSRFRREMLAGVKADLAAGRLSAPRARIRTECLRYLFRNGPKRAGPGPGGTP